MHVQDDRNLCRLGLRQGYPKRSYRSVDRRAKIARLLQNVVEPLRPAGLHPLSPPCQDSA